MSDIMIEMKNLTRFFGPVRALDSIFLQVRRGEVMGFLGPNGAGKTTTMRILAGLLAPSEGEVFISGIDMLENPVAARGKVGFLPETPPLYLEMTVEEYLNYLGSLRNIAKSQLKGAVEAAMERCGLTEVRRRLLRNLSKGYRQRSGIAQAIVHNPEVVILDEPTVGLDPIQIREIRSLIRELGGEHSVLLSTHILSEVQMTCDRVAVIHQGRIVFEDSLQGLENRTKSKQVYRVRMNRPPAKEEVEAIPGFMQVACEKDIWTLYPQPPSDPIPEFLQRAVVGGWDVRELTPTSGSLEEIFVQLAHGDSDVLEYTNEVAA